MATTAITWVTYVAAVLLMFLACLKIHRKIRSKGSLLLLLTLPFYVFAHNAAMSAFAFFMNHGIPAWANNWVVWAITQYMPIFVMLLASVGVFAVSRSIVGLRAEA